MGASFYWLIAIFQPIVKPAFRAEPFPGFKYVFTFYFLGHLAFYPLKIWHQGLPPLAPAFGAALGDGKLFAFVECLLPHGEDEYMSAVLAD